MTTTLMQISTESARQAAAGALRAAGLEVVEVRNLEEARQAAARDDSAALVLCEAKAFAGADAAAVPQDAVRKLSHDLRTPLSAMAGWLHLLESGRMDEAGMKRALEKLRGNIDDQVRTIDRFLGAYNQEGTRK